MGKYPFSDFQDERRESRRPKPKAREVKIKPTSKKRAKQTREYQVIRIQYLIDNPICEARIKCCGNKATEVHHMEGRIGKLLTDIENFIAVCQPCHRYIEENPNVSKEKGFSLNRLT